MNDWKRRERFVVFCANNVGDGKRGEGAKIAASEWKGLTTDDQIEIVDGLQDISNAMSQAMRLMEHVNDNKKTLKRLPTASGIRRIKILDRLDIALEDALNQRGAAIQAIDMLLRRYTANTKTRNALFPSLQECRDDNREARISVEKDLERIRTELHALKRRAPGRKVEIEMSEEREAELLRLARERANMIPSLPTPTPLFTSPPDTRWKPVHLGDEMGAMNEGITIWFGLDAVGRIQYRFICKYLGKANSDWYRCGDLDGTEESKKYLKEYATHLAVAEQPEANFVTKLGKQPVWPLENDTFRLRMEYAPFGDLWDLLDCHAKAAPASARPRTVPEDFLWLLFQSMIESACIMKNGRIAKDQPQPERWMEVVHRDWKPENIVLCGNHEEHFRAYPRPKVTDFGLAIFTDADDPINPEYLRGGTEGLMPPEQTLYEDPKTGKSVDRFKMLSPCNVWGLGAVMYQAMTFIPLSKTTQPTFNIPSPDDSTPDDDDDDDDNLGQETDDEDKVWPEDLGENHFRYSFPASTRTKYSAALCDKVEACLAFEPKDRPTVESLVDWIHKHMRSDARLRRLARGEEPGGPEALPLFHNPEKHEYTLGFQWPVGPTLQVVNP